MKTILLIQTSSGYWDLLQGRSLPLPILHAATLACRKFDLILLDLRSTILRREKLREVLRRDRPFIVGLTVMIGPQIKQAIEISRMVKALVPDTTIIWGGVFPSLSPELVLSEESVDCVIAGEGEETLLRLAETLASGGELEDVPNVLFRGEGEDILGERQGDFLDLNGLPALPYNLLPLDHYRPLVRRGGALSVETSRGCPHACSFCYNLNFCRRRWRPRSPDRIEEEIIRLHRLFGTGKIFFMDDNFFIDLERAMAIAERTARLKIRWGTHGLTPSAAISLDTGDLRVLHRTGCDELKIGLENISPRIMKEMGKVFDKDKFRDFNSRLSRFSITVEYSVIFGFPGETREDLHNNIQYIFTLLQENPNARMFMINLLFPFPGTEVYEKHTNQAWRQRWSLQRYGAFEISSSGGPWLSDREASLLRAVNFSSLFISSKRLGHSPRSPGITELLRSLYRPVARYRLEKLSFGIAPEVLLGNALLRTIARCLR